MMRAVVVTDYNPAWPIWFNQLRDRIWPAIKGAALSIEHVGSTSVPGLAAKPVIDLDVVIRASEDLPAIVQQLAALGYQHQGDLGIEGREAFRAPSNAPIPHHLYVCVANSLPLRNHILLRDHLRSHPEDMAAYAMLKKNLANQHPNDIDRYVEGKSAFILEILRLGGLNASQLAAIRAANRSTLPAAQNAV
jgi:GrpB-like predicted nucleotidyltransferase (UPF0157 family)